MDHLDTLVIGAGVVGLACARALAHQGHEVLVLEAASGIGTGTSARNSEVIHAGLYYATGSLKARLCVAGRKALYAYAKEHGVAHQQCGKLLVATHQDQHPKLLEIHQQSLTNGLTGEDALTWLDAGQVHALEPALVCTAALLSPSTGIIDSHGLMLALQGDLEHAGGQVVLNTRVIDISLDLTAAEPQHTLTVESGGETMTISARRVINCAGLSAVAIAKQMHHWPHPLPSPRFAKGDYFSLQARAPFRRLIYPLPEPGGLGIHLTLDLAGRAKFGPDVTWLPESTDPHKAPDSIDYTVNPNKAEQFARSIQRFWPAISVQQLQADYSGVRPKLCGPTDPAADFMLLGPGEHGIAGLVQCLGVESPGLTSALAIADWVAQSIQG